MLVPGERSALVEHEHAQQSSTLATMFFNHRACILVLSQPRELGMAQMVDLRFILHRREPPNHGPKDCPVSTRRKRLNDFLTLYANPAEEQGAILDCCRIGTYYEPFYRLWKSAQMPFGIT